MIKYSKKLADYVCGEIEKGRTLTSICKEEGVPSHATIHKWVKESDCGEAVGKEWENFGPKYKSARETQINHLIDQMHDIADAPPPVPPQKVRDENGNMIPLEGTDRKLWVNAENQRRRLKVDAIKFHTAKLAGVMGHNLEKGVMVQGDTINIINYSTDQPLDFQKKPSNIEVKEVGFIDTSKHENHK